MMEKAKYEPSLQDEFDKGLSTLEDIQMLSEFSLSPLISRAYFHLTEMKRIAEVRPSQGFNHLGQISKALDEHFATICQDFFSNKSKFKEFELIKSTSKIDLTKWNLLFETLPELLSVVAIFNYHGPMEMRLDENRLVVTGTILDNGHLEMNRKFIYVVTRKLLRQKVLLTFSLEKTSRTGLFKLDLKLDISHDESLVYKVNFKPNTKENYIVGFSNIFCHYRSSLEHISRAGEHNVVEVDNDLSVNNYFGVLDLDRLESANKEILHFPFLFRPVSIILPMKGKLSKREQDVSTNDRTIDFFSLFNQ